MSKKDYKYINHYLDIDGNDNGIGRVLSFNMPVNSSIMLRLVMTRGTDDQVGVIILSVLRPNTGVYSASRMAFVNQSAAFKSKAFVYYNGDKLYIRFGHYDRGAYNILAESGWTTFEGVLNNPSLSGFTEVNVADMVLNPTI